MECHYHRQSHLLPSYEQFHVYTTPLIHVKFHGHTEPPTSSKYIVIDDLQTNFIHNLSIYSKPIYIPNFIFLHIFDKYHLTMHISLILQHVNRMHNRYVQRIRPAFVVICNRRDFRNKYIWHEFFFYLLHNFIRNFSQNTNSERYHKFTLSLHAKCLLFLPDFNQS
jgi:hypothetical protein